MVKLDYDKQAEEFNAVWEKRRQAPYVTESWTSNEWARGRTEYLTFLIRVKDREVIDRVKEIQAELAEFRCVDPFPEEYLHITVKETGCFIVDSREAEDEYTRADLPAITGEARRILDGHKPFTVELRNINNFRSTVCVQGQDGGVIRSINRDLMGVPGVRRMSHDSPLFLPHLSVAQYRSTRDYERLIGHLEAVRETWAGDLSVENIHLAIAHLPVRGIYPRLETVAEFRL